jgi:hypothetical protein
MRLEFVREAVPFDTVEASLHLERQEGREVELSVLYARVAPGAEPVRLAVGRLAATFEGAAEWPTLRAGPLSHPGPVPHDTEARVAK